MGSKSANALWISDDATTDHRFLLLGIGHYSGNFFYEHARSVSFSSQVLPFVVWNCNTNVVIKSNIQTTCVEV